MTDNIDDFTHRVTNHIPFYPTPSHPCPTCGHCPTCGRPQAIPFNPYPSPYGTITVTYASQE